jgi:hypothetical protein
MGTLGSPEVRAWMAFMPRVIRLTLGCKGDVLSVERRRNFDIRYQPRYLGFGIHVPDPSPSDIS